MSQDNGPGRPGGNAGASAEGKPGGDHDLESRRKALDAALSARKVEEEAVSRGRKDGGAGFANALKLSSEFIAGIVVGAAIGYLIDQVAGTSPWGMIVFLLLGFGAGVLNVMRSAGVVADPQSRPTDGPRPDDTQD